MRLQNAAALCASFPPDVRGQPYRVSPGISEAWSDLGLRERNAMELEQGNGEIGKDLSAFNGMLREHNIGNIYLKTL
jgi:hypothetical protein